MSFINDLKNGKIVEQQVSEILRERFTNIKDNSDWRFDLETSIKFEVKNDKRAIETGNVAIEMEYNGNPSGIFHTEADIWVYKIDEDVFWFYRKDIVNYLETNKERYKVMNGGDGWKSKLALIPIYDFLTKINPHKI